MAKKFRIVQAPEREAFEDQLDKAALETTNFKIEGFNSKVVMISDQEKAKVVYAALVSFDED